MNHYRQGIGAPIGDRLVFSPAATMELPDDLKDNICILMLVLVR